MEETIDLTKTGRPAAPEVQKPAPAKSGPIIKNDPATGWWSIGNVKGTRDGVLKLLAGSQLADAWKAVIKSEIESFPAEFNFIQLNAHFHRHKNHDKDFTLSILPSVAVV